METLLVAGIDTVAGANIALTLSDRTNVVGLSFSNPVSIAGCTTDCCRPASRDAILEWVASTRPDRIVLCGPASQSAWELAEADQLSMKAIASASDWASAARQFNCELTLISSDAVFKGPWMFHCEDGESLDESPSARIIRAVEQAVFEKRPNALVARTHAYGWKPAAAGPGWIEKRIDAVARKGGDVTTRAYATPLPASHLAEVLHQAHQKNLTGVCHVGGSERVSRAQFVARLAAVMQLKTDAGVTVGMHEVYETSLQSRRIRQELEVTTPMLTDGLEELHTQRENGYRDNLNAGSERVVRDLVA